MAAHAWLVEASQLRIPARPRVVPWPYMATNVVPAGNFLQFVSWIAVSVICSSALLISVP